MTLGNNPPKNKLFDQFIKIIIFSFVIVLTSFVNNRSLFLSIEFLFILLLSYWNLVNNSKINLYAVWSLVLVITALNSIFVAVNQLAVFRYAISLIQPLIICNLLIPYMDKSEENYLLIIKSVGIASIILAGRLLIVTPPQIWGTERIGLSIGYNPNIIGLITSFGSLLMYNNFMIEKKKIYILATLMLGFFSFFTGSRKALAVVLFGITFIYFLNVSSIKKLLKYSILSIVIILLVINIINVWNPLYNILGRRVELMLGLLTEGRVDNSTLTRVTMVQDGWKLFLNNPLWGYGLDNYKIVSGDGRYSHNNYIELLVSLGLFGTITYYSIHIYIISRLVKNKRKLKFKSNLNFKMTATNFGILIIFIILVIDMGWVSYYNEIFNIYIAIAFSSIGHSNLSKKI